MAMLSDIFTPRQLQEAKTLLEVLAERGVNTVSDALAALVEAIGPMPTVEVAKAETRAISPPCPTIRPDGSPCPGRLYPVHNADGLRLIGCRICRYSRLDEVR